MPSLPRTLAIAAAIAAPLFLGGCLERTIHITSDPPGALVWLNDIEVGRTPLETDFTYYGEFSVRLRREGYEPIVTSRTAKAPVYEWPVVDLAAELWPQRISTDIRWHFDLVPAAERTDADAAREDILRRAAETRDLLSQP
jgi:hypothetical protein